MPAPLSFFIALDGKQNGPGMEQRWTLALIFGVDKPSSSAERKNFLQCVTLTGVFQITAAESSDLVHSSVT